MKKFFVLVAVIAALVLAGCNPDAGNNPPTTTELTVKNETSRTITDIKWNGTTLYGSLGTSSYFHQAPGEKGEATVSAGQGYVFFNIYENYSSSPTYRTNELVVVGKDESKEFSITGNTLVVVGDGSVVKFADLP